VKKHTNNSGFTLAELLIVVAIIAVLVAVSIPVFVTQLEKSRESTDLANMRAARALIVSAYLSDDVVNHSAGYTMTQQIAQDSSQSACFWYDAQDGALVLYGDRYHDMTWYRYKNDVYGKGTSTAGMGAKGEELYCGYTTATEARGKVLEIGINADGDVRMGWISYNAFTGYANLDLY